MTEYQSNRRPPAKVRLPIWVVLLIAAAAFFLLVGGGFWIYSQFFGLAADSTVTAPDLTGIESDSADSQAPSSNNNGQLELSDPNITSSFAEEEGVPVIAQLDAFSPWEGTERLNILLVGIDIRCEEEGPTRTDSMMVISIDPVGKSVSGLSIPRDTWVDIPGFGQDRVNQAYYNGEAFEYPGGGSALAMETVGSFLGIKLENFVSINFEGFRDFINLIDGIQVDVPETINDPTYPDECYGYDPFFIEQGVRSMNGPIALQYARTRATINGDIDRAARQQQVVMAVRDKIFDLNMVPQLITATPKLWRTFQNNFQTSFTDTEVIQLALLGQEIPRENIQMGVIDFNYVYNETTIDGRQVLVPNQDAVRELRETLFTPVAAPEPVIENIQELVTDEDARVLILNGTQVFGLAGKTQEYLVDLGVNVTDIGNADAATYPTTQIIDYGNHPTTVLYLTQQMDLPPLNSSSSNETNEAYDILIILGADWELPEG